MNLTNEDKTLLQDLCRQHEVNFYKVIKLLETVREHEFKDRRAGIYDALREIIKTNFETSKGAD